MAVVTGMALPMNVRAQDAAALQANDAPTNAVWLESLELNQMTQDYGSPQAGKSVDGNPIKLKGVTYPHGVGTHARSEFVVDLKKSAVKFVSMVGLDDEKTGAGSVTFEVWVDGKKAAETGVLHGGDEPKLLSVDLTGAKTLMLVVTDAEDGIDSDHGDWAGAMIVQAPGATARPTAFQLPPTPPPAIFSNTSTKTAIHGPRIVGSTPRHPFLFLIPATGEGPLSFAAKNLPAGLKLDGRTGVISGSLAKAGTTDAVITVKGKKGAATRKLRIVGGTHKLAMTPPMGWNSWNVWAGAVDDAKVRAAADWMVKSGLAAHGFQYVNIDDTWEAGRDAEGNIQTNEKFPAMNALTDYVHSKGLKVGIYSSPGPKTCGGFEGSYKHEQQDANTWAKWGIDYIKYDWCSYGDVATGDGVEKMIKPYRVLGEALSNVDRDIFFSLCQYGMGDVWEWGKDIYGNCWRTTGDINDSWGSLKSIAFGHTDNREKYAGPGHWNDPDMLVVGKVGWGPSIHPTRLTPNEQLTHISMWCLVSAPLLIGCDMSQMDKFTVDLLSNDEVLDINQDPLGKSANRRAKDGMLEVWARPLWDGTTAVGLFNTGAQATKVTAKWSDIGVTGAQPVRDLWQHKSLGTAKNAFSAQVPPHGVVLVKIGMPNKTDW